MFDSYKPLRFATLPLAFAIGLALAPAANADEPVQGSEPFTVSFSPSFERTADGNTFIDYTFTETFFLGIVEGTRVGSGELVIHQDGSFNTANSGIFTGTIAGRSGAAEMDYRGSGTFAAAGGNLAVTGMGGLAGVRAEGRDSASATSPTSFAGTISFNVNASAP